MRQRRRERAAWPALLGLTALALLGGCTSADPEGDLSPDGQAVEVLATWSGDEQQRFEAVLRAFERRSGADVTYTPTSHRLPEELVRRIRDGDPPDVAVLPQPGLLRELARAGHLVPLDAPTRELVATWYLPVLQDLGSSGGELYGVWFKLANKSLVWYDVATFERLGEVPPADLTGLLALARRLAAAGTPAFAVSTADAWTLTDWFENLLLRLAGPQVYDDLATHRIPWTSPAVLEVLRWLDALLPAASTWPAPRDRPGATFEESVEAVFARPSRAAMVVQGDFVAGVVRGRTDARLGVDADVFAFPAGPAADPGSVAGGDVAVLLRASDAGTALLRFLATDEAAAVWAARGGFLSPHLGLDLDAYPDAVSRAVARQLLEAADGLHFDLSDLQPAAFGGAEESGLPAELRDFLLHRDAARTAARLEAAAAAAFAASPGADGTTGPGATGAGPP